MKCNILRSIFYFPCRESLTEVEYEGFFRSTQCIVEKDVVRTDRSHHYFKGDDNPNIEILK